MPEKATAIHCQLSTTLKNGASVNTHMELAMSIAHEVVKSSVKLIEELNPSLAIIGNGASITAADKGRLWILMGFTPLGGVMMWNTYGDTIQRLIYNYKHTDDFKHAVRYQSNFKLRESDC